MQLTKTGEYAIRSMIELASAPFGNVIQISDISERWDIPVNFLRKIISVLVKAGLVHSQRGNGGGIQLAKPADQLTLLDVIEAVEGKIFLNECLMGPQICSRSSWCGAHVVWCEAQQALKEILNKRSLIEIVALNNANKMYQNAASNPFRQVA